MKYKVTSVPAISVSSSTGGGRAQPGHSPSSPLALVAVVVGTRRAKRVQINKFPFRLRNFLRDHRATIADFMPPSFMTAPVRLTLKRKMGRSVSSYYGECYIWLFVDQQARSNLTHLDNRTVNLVNIVFLSDNGRRGHSGVQLFCNRCISRFVFLRFFRSTKQRYLASIADDVSQCNIFLQIFIECSGVHILISTSWSLCAFEVRLILFYERLLSYNIQTTPWYSFLCAVVIVRICAH